MEQQELKQKYSKDEISKLESMNPDGNSQSLDDDNEEQYQTSSESSVEFSSSPDCYSDDDDGDSDSLPLLQLKSKQTTPVNEWCVHRISNTLGKLFLQSVEGFNLSFWMKLSVATCVINDF